MNVLFNTLTILLTFSSLSFSQPDWEWQYSTTTENLNDVYFLDDDKGWIVGDNGVILSTIDGGQTWNQESSSTTENLKVIHFIDENLGWAVGGRTMLFSEDGGFSWSIYPQNLIMDIQCIFFVDKYTGWVCGSDSVILRTTNSGGKWEVILSRVGKFDAIYFLNDTLGWLHSRDDAGHIYMTTDGGHTLIAMSRSRKSFRSFFFIDSQKGWACGGTIDDLNKIFGWVDISTDGAHVWESQFSEGLMYSLHFFDETHGIALGLKNRGPFINKIYEVFYKTVDGGYTWMSCEPGGKAFYFIDKNTGWMVGNLGKIYKTSNGGGLLNIHSKKSSLLNKYNLSQNYPNPFNPTTAIGYQLSAVSDVEVSIYNLLGQKVITLVSARQEAGQYEVEWNASGLASGIYYYRLKASEFVEVKKMALLR